MDGDHTTPEETIKDDGASGIGATEEMIEENHDEIDTVPKDQELQLKETHLSSSSEMRVTSAFLESFLDNDGTDPHSTALELREMISRKMSEHLEGSSDRAAIKLIHSIAPKIPAIRHSPDVTLRIRATVSDPDPGIAACLIAAGGKLVESLSPKDKEKAREHVSKDRRFEQALECILCGINEESEKKFFEAESLSDDAQFNHVDETIANTLGDGLSLRDCCRAAYGLSSLCDYESSIGQERVSNCLLVLMRRVYCLLRLEFHRIVTSEVEHRDEMNIDTYLSKSCRRLAENTLLALWSFLKSQMTSSSLRPLLDFCSTALCLDPLQLRKRYQEKSDSLGANDVVDRLVADADESEGQSTEQRDVLVDWLTGEEIVDTVHALARDGSQEGVSEDEDHTLKEICFDRLLHLILEESKTPVDSAREEPCEDEEPRDIDVPSEQDDTPIAEHSVPTVELVDASRLLATEGKQQLDSPVEKSRKIYRSAFSSLDLCTIAWSATELDASLRSRIVCRILLMLASSSSELILLENLPVRALIGAAWAFSKIDEGEDGYRDFSVGNDVLVVGWIVDEIIQRRGKDPEIFCYTPANLLSRFAWSIGVIYDKRVDGTRIATTDASDLIRQILTMASLNDRRENEQFLTEDQV